MAWAKLGIIAGGGDLPVALAEHQRDEGREYFVARVAPFADAALEDHPGATHDLGAMGARIDALKAAGCDAVVIVGGVPRPDWSVLEWDDAAKLMLPALGAAAREGDDALLRALIDEHVKAGLNVIGADEAVADLVAPRGVLGAQKPSVEDMRDIQRAITVVESLGALDVGQGAVVADGLVLAVEAQEGTDAMLARVAGLPPSMRGSPGDRWGVLVKRPKPGQERRIDLPVIGVRTIEMAAQAGLAGVAVEAGASLIVRRAKVIESADALGLFVYGFKLEQSPAA